MIIHKTSWYVFLTAFTTFHSFIDTSEVLAQTTKNYDGIHSMSIQFRYPNDWRCEDDRMSASTSYMLILVPSNSYCENCKIEVIQYFSEYTHIPTLEQTIKRLNQFGIMATLNVVAHEIFFSYYDMVIKHVEFTGLRKHDHRRIQRTYYFVSRRDDSGIFYLIRMIALVEDVHKLQKLNADLLQIVNTFHIYP
jgi:hypothetical protein